MRPRTGERNVEVITPGFSAKTAFAVGAGLAVSRDPVAALRLFALERAVLAAFVPLVLSVAIYE